MKLTELKVENHGEEEGFISNLKKMSEFLGDDNSNFNMNSEEEVGRINVCRKVSPL
jgi:hypothetical protein